MQREIDYEKINQSNREADDKILRTMGALPTASHEEQRERAVRFLGFYEKNKTAVCHVCQKDTSMYFLSKRGWGDPALCICHIGALDLDDNIWTYDRFRTVMRPIYEQHEKIEGIFFRHGIGFDYRQPGTGGGGDSLTAYCGERLHSIIQKYSDVFYAKMKSATGIRRQLEEIRQPAELTDEQKKAKIDRGVEMIIERLHALDNEVPPF